MKKSLFTFAVLSTISGISLSQSSVTLFLA